MGKRDNEALNYFFFNSKNLKLFKKWKGGGGNLVFAAFPASLHLGRYRFITKERMKSFTSALLLWCIFSKDPVT